MVMPGWKLVLGAKRMTKVLGALVVCMGAAAVGLKVIQPDSLRSSTAFVVPDDLPTGDVGRVLKTQTPLRNWRGIVIHHSAMPSGNAERIDAAHRARGYDGLGYHFVLCNGDGGSDGEIQVGYRWDRQLEGAHAYVPKHRYNQTTIGICLIGNFSQSRPTKGQMKRLIKLVKVLRRRCRIDQKNIHLHNELKNTQCPGRYFPAESFFRAIRD